MTMKCCCILVVLACTLPASSAFGVQPHRCPLTQSTVTLKSSSSTVESGGDKKKSLFSKRKVTIKSAGDVEESIEATAASAKAMVDYDGMTVVSLKELLRERGLQVSGLKDELKIRLKLDDITSTSTSKESDDFDNGVFSSSEKDFLGKLPGTVPEVSTSAWVKSSSETAFNDRKFKDQLIQEENKIIVRFVHPV